ncbi:hypothetical protein HPB50_026901 [Hyalomma asiaticum]|uniref:Uncharacterized protein n=1 Tax=Hyalomma asiaticum TaxID=266040 RepID=A0ACB7S425_HYAAI|nr:hypothetical protein HPB50_026901 [Hyalomma asiaticum]
MTLLYINTCVQRDRSYDAHKAKCMAAVLPSVEASMREKEACRIVVEATNMSSAAFWTVTQVQLDLESKRALCLREALPDTPEDDRDDAFLRAAQEANALTKRHTDLRQKEQREYRQLLPECQRRLFPELDSQQLQDKLDSALAKGDLSLYVQWELQNFHVVQACARQVYDNTTNEAMRTQLLAEYEKYMDNTTIEKASADWRH